MTVSNLHPFRLLGAVAPSSTYLAQAMTRFVEPKRLNILEVGAGTGAITKALIKKMAVEQKTDVVEIFPYLAAVLERRFKSYESIAIHCADILQFQTKVKYDLIISSLPFNAFLPEVTAAVIRRLIDLAEDFAIMSFFEYKSVQGFAPLFMGKEKLEQFYRSRSLIEEFIAPFKFDEAVVNINIPPAVVHHLRINKSYNLSKNFGV